MDTLDFVVDNLLRNYGTGYTEDSGEYTGQGAC